MAIQHVMSFTHRQNELRRAKLKLCEQVLFHFMSIDQQSPPCTGHDSTQHSRLTLQSNQDLSSPNLHYKLQTTCDTEGITDHSANMLLSLLHSLKFDNVQNTCKQPKLGNERVGKLNVLNDKTCTMKCKVEKLV